MEFFTATIPKPKFEDAFIQNRRLWVRLHEKAGKQMNTVQGVINFVEQQPFLMALLRVVATLKIDDCWIGAGVVRNAVWDYLHNYPVQLTPGSDVDVIYFDRLSVNFTRAPALRRVDGHSLVGW